jgi:uncharacterized protein YecT (DUF1311 family)
MLGFVGKGFQVRLSKGVRMVFVLSRKQLRQPHSAFLTYPSSKKRSVLASVSIALTLASGLCFADQWPSHPLPTKSSEVAAYSHAIGLRPSLSVCIKEADGTTPGIHDCLRDEHGFQDHRLNVNYKKLMGSLSEAGRKHLREEERRWIAFRDKFCAADGEPGQGQELESDECLVDQTADRATELESRQFSR